MKSYHCIRVDDEVVASADNCDYGPGSKTIGRMITRIKVQCIMQGQGHGTALLRMICDDADKEGVSLFLEIEPGETAMTYEQLEAWYMRYGFRQWRGVYRRISKKEGE